MKTNLLYSINDGFNTIIFMSTYNQYDYIIIRHRAFF